MSETPQPGPEQQNGNLDAKKYTDALHQLFIVLMEFRRTFGSQEFQTNAASDISVKQNPKAYDALRHSSLSMHERRIARDVLVEATRETLSEGSMSLVNFKVDGFDGQLRVIMVDDIAIWTAAQSANPDNPEPFLLSMNLGRPNDPGSDDAPGFYFSATNYIGTKAACMYGEYYLHGLTDEKLETFNRLIGYIGIELVDPGEGQYFSIEENRIAPDNIARIAGSIQRFMEDEGVAYEVTGSTLDQQETG